MSAVIIIGLFTIGIIGLFIYKSFFKDFNLSEMSKTWDARYNFPRPANEQYLDSEKAFLKLARDYGFIFFYLICACASILSLFYIWIKLGEMSIPADSPVRIIPFVICAVLVIVFFFIDQAVIFLPYRGEFQRQTLGTGRWATVSVLKAKKLLLENGSKFTKKHIPLIPFGSKHWFSVPIDVLAQHLIILGASGSGKTKSFYMNLIRRFSELGGQVILDVKGEIFEYTAAYMGDVYRFDLDNAVYTDFFDIFGPCRDDPVAAGRVASYIIGGTSGKSSADPFWNDSANLMLKCLILHLCSKYDNPSPSDIFDFLATHPTEYVDPTTGETRDLLYEAMENSTAPGVSAEWGSFFNLVGKSPKTLGSIAGVMLSKLAVFRDPKVAAATRPPTPREIQMGRRKIDFKALRRKTSGFRTDGEKRGVAVYVVVKEGDADRLKTVLSTFFSMAKDVLKEQLDEEKDEYVMFNLDEAGNVPLSNLSQDFGVGRGRRLIFNLGFQSISQLANLYGNEVAKTIFENNGTYIIYPGSKDGTAEWVSKMLSKTTTLTRSSADAANDSFDTEKLSEQSRDLMHPNEIREMKKYTQALILHDDAPPVRARCADDATKLDTRRFNPRPKVEIELLEQKWVNPGLSRQDMPAQISNNNAAPKQIAGLGGFASGTPAIDVVPNQETTADLPFAPDGNEINRENPQVSEYESASENFDFPMSAPETISMSEQEMQDEEIPNVPESDYTDPSEFKENVFDLNEQ